MTSSKLKQPARKNKLPNCKYTPKQLARKIDLWMDKMAKLETEYGEVKVNMYLTHVEAFPKVRACGCVAGLSTLVLPCPKIREEGAYGKGRIGIAHYLGFRDRYQLELFTKHFPSVWPPTIGDFNECFESPRAYFRHTEKLKFPNIPLFRVISFWREAAQNLRTLPEEHFQGQQEIFSYGNY